MTLKVILHRVYEPADSPDGFRVLVDRLWPRGVSKEDLKFDLWCKDLAPSSELRKWFGHQVENWPTFCERYRAELHTAEQQQRIKQLLDLAQDQPIVLLYGAKDSEHNQAVVLAQELGHAKRPR